MRRNSHAVVMHNIAQLTLFCYRLLVLGCLMGMVFYQMLVSRYHHLSCHKADQNNPGVNDMSFTLFQTALLRSDNNYALLQK